MSIDKEMEDFEKKYKEALFKKLLEVSSRLKETIDLIQETSSFANIQGKLPNIVITLNNKIIEISHEFRKEGTSMFARRIKGYDGVWPSYIGEAIINDIIGMVNQGMQELEDYNVASGEIHNEKMKKIQNWNSMGTVKRMFVKLRGLLIPSTKIDFSYTPEETDELKSYLDGYVEIDQQLWRYNFKNNIVSAIVKHMKKSGDSRENALRILEESIREEFIKLGLSELIPQLEAEIKDKSFDKAREGKTSWYLSPEQQAKIEEHLKGVPERYGNETATGRNVVTKGIEEGEGRQDE